MRFDPRLNLSPETMYEIEVGGGGPVLPSVVFSSACPFPLTCEPGDDDVFVRAATGEEATDTLTTGPDEGDDPDWPGDPPERLATTMIWREGRESEPEEDASVLLWSGEVLLRSG
ncbi:MAG: hypothetical protein ABI369_04910 [Acetobacteraceae bacterium]